MSLAETQKYFIYFLSIKCTERVYPILIKNNTLARRWIGFWFSQDNENKIKTVEMNDCWSILSVYVCTE